MTVTEAATATPEQRAASGELTGDEFMALVNSRDVRARVAAASRVDAPLGVLVSFAQDRKTEVRVAVAGNSAIGSATAVQSILAEDRSADVARALIRNDDVARAAIELIAQDGPRAARSEASARLA